MLLFVTPFPALLDFSLFAPTLLRLALGIFILAIGFSAQHKGETGIKPELTPLQITFRSIFILAGISLIIGLYVQCSALAVVLLMAASIADKRLRLTSELNRAEMSLLLIIAISLMLTGAGQYALDLPL